MFKEEDFIFLSALQHFLFCNRQCALIHIERAWEENIFTTQGRIMHENAHQGHPENRDGVRIERGIALRSDLLGIKGAADVVEFHKNYAGILIPFPVEYKHGKPKEDGCDKVQLCAQALCLEEMQGVDISKGALYYGKTRRRLDVNFDQTLREATKRAILELRQMLHTGSTPKPMYRKKCDSCSLFSLCMPKMFEQARSVSEYLKEGMTDS